MKLKSFLLIKISIQVMDAKPLLKEALQAAVGLPVDKKIPLIGFIGRLEEQKGSDILVAAIHKFIELDVQIVVLVSTKWNHSIFLVEFTCAETEIDLLLILCIRELAKRSLSRRLNSSKCCTLIKLKEWQNSMSLWLT